MLGKSLVALKARLVGIEDGELLAGQQLWLVHLRDSPPLGSSGGQPGPRGGAGTYRVGRVLLVLQIGVVQVLSALHAPQRVGLGQGHKQNSEGGRWATPPPLEHRCYPWLQVYLGGHYCFGSGHFLLHSENKAQDGLVF